MRKLSFLNVFNYYVVSHRGRIVSRQFAASLKFNNFYADNENKETILVIFKQIKIFSYSRVHKN